MNDQYLQQKNFEIENKSLEINGLNLLFTPELFLSIGVIFAINKSIHNPFIWTTILFFLLFLIHKGTSSTVKGAFRGTFQYEYDLPKRFLFIFYDVDLDCFCCSKIILFKKITFFYVLLNSFFLIVISFIIHGFISILILPFFVLLLLFHKHLCT
jgi:hypothetical protein